MPSSLPGPQQPPGRHRCDEVCLKVIAHYQALVKQTGRLPSLSQIDLDLGLSHRKAYYVIHLIHRLPINERGSYSRGAPRHDCEQIRRLYVDEHLTLKQVAERMHGSLSSVWRCLKFHLKLPRRQYSLETLSSMMQAKRRELRAERATESVGVLEALQDQRHGNPTPS